MQAVEVARVVPAEPSVVWRIYTDHAGWNRWAGVHHSSLVVRGKPEPNGPGAVRRLGSFGFYAFEEILEFDPPRRMTYRFLKGAFPMKNHLGEVRFEPCPEGTRIVWRCEFDSKIPGLGGPTAWYVTRFFRKALDGLCRLLSAGPRR